MEMTCSLHLVWHEVVSLIRKVMLIRLALR